MWHQLGRARSEFRPAKTRATGPDLLRALAIISVMVFHLPSAAMPGWLAMIKPYGWVGVDIFFVLRGYLIGTQLMRSMLLSGPVELGSFYRRRAFRILPAYFVVIGAYILFPGLRDAPTMAIL